MPFTNKTILAIDDTASIRTFLHILLEAQGAIFHDAATANAGLEACKTIKPDLVVLDLGLPDRDGLDILSELKNCNENEKPPKVVILSVRKEQNIKDRARRLGADAYLTKPFLMEELLEIIDKELNADTSGNNK